MQREAKNVYGKMKAENILIEYHDNLENGTIRCSAIIDGKLQSAGTLENAVFKTGAAEYPKTLADRYDDETCVRLEELANRLAGEAVKNAKNHYEREKAKRTEEEKRMSEFMEGLAELTKKTGVAVAGCGCCGSPYLTEAVAGTRYDHDDSFNNIRWG